MSGERASIPLSRPFPIWFSGSLLVSLSLSFFPSLSLRLYVGYIQVRKFLKVDRAFDLKIRFWKVYNNNKRKENSKTKMTPD